MGRQSSYTAKEDGVSRVEFSEIFSIRHPGYGDVCRAV